MSKVKTRKTRSSDQRPRSKVPKTIDPDLLKWLRGKKATNSEVEIYLAVKALQEKQEFVKNPDIAGKCNMHRVTVIYHARNMIEKSILIRDENNAYKVKEPRA